MNPNLKVIFLGGVGDMGKNCTALQFGDDILVIDAGVSFPGDDMPGIDLIIPDFTWLKENKDKVKGIVITHAHEDHIGATPYLINEVKAPIYGSRLSIALIENKLREHPQVHARANVVKPKSVVRIGNFVVEFVNVNHSVAGAFALSITTPVGVVFVTGDFKIDFTPLSDAVTDLARIGEIGNRGVLLLMCDSTNVERLGHSISESTVAAGLEEIFKKSVNKRIIITAFATNVHRMQLMMDLAKQYKRKVAFAGRSMINNMEIAMKIGEIKFDHQLIVDIEKIKNYAHNEILILATGSQGQPNTALSRMANGEFNNVHIGEHDVIVYSSSPVPGTGNERLVANTINELTRCGAEVISNDEVADVHASGHAYQDEIKTIHALLRPKFFMPVHGDYKQQKVHRELSENMGMKPQSIIVPEIGDVIEISANTIKKTGTVQAGARLVDGLGVGDEESIVLRDRKQLAEEGMCLVVVAISSKNGSVVSGPDIITRGLIYSHEAEGILQEAKTTVEKTLNDSDLRAEDRTIIKSNIRRSLSNLLYKKTKRRPMILPIVVDV
ncbi:MAG: ribonuclease J [Firmicutes bacterium]|nr:ribonuclease J [Bacillota bacterium]